MLLSDLNIEGIILFCLCPRGLKQKEGRKKPAPFWKGKHPVIKYTFPESWRTDVLSLPGVGGCGLWEGCTQSMFHNLKKSRGLRKVPKHGRSGWGKFLLVQQHKRELTTVFGNHIFLEFFFSLNSQDEKDFYHRKLIEFLKLRKKKNLLDLAKTVLLSKLLQRFP